MKFLIVMLSIVFSREVRILQGGRYLTTFKDFIRLLSEEELRIHRDLCTRFDIGGGLTTSVIQDKVGMCKEPGVNAVTACPLNAGSVLTWDIIPKGDLVMLKASDGTCATNIQIPYSNVPGLCIQGKPCKEDDPNQLFEIAEVRNDRWRG